MRGMREIKVRNASIYATVNGHKVDVEIRSTKDSAQGIALLVDGVMWLEVDMKPDGTISDTPPPYLTDKKPLFQVKLLTVGERFEQWREAYKQAYGHYPKAKMEE